jgi:hypothetical protein
MTPTLTKARRAVKHAQPDGAFLPAPRQVPNSPAEVGFSPSGSATAAAVRRDAPTYLDGLTAAHAFLVHQGHPTSATHLEPLVKAARCALLNGGA